MKTVAAPKRVVEWKGCLVRSRVEVGNMTGSLPAGSLWTVESSGSLKRLRSFGCPHCGLALEVTTKEKAKDFLRDFEFVEMEEEEAAGLMGRDGRLRDPGFPPAARCERCGHWKDGRCDNKRSPTCGIAVSEEEAMRFGCSAFVPGF